MLKATNPEVSISVVWSNDPAIDNTKSKLIEYMEEKFVDNPEQWQEYLFAKEGDKFTEFVIGVIPSAVLCRIEDDAGIGRVESSEVKINAMYWQCFLEGIRNIKNGPTVDLPMPQNPKKFRKGVPTEIRNDVSYVARYFLEDTFQGPLRNAAIDIGGIIYRWQRMANSDVKN